LKVYSDEVIVFLEMMVAKDKIERSVGFKKKAGRSGVFLSTTGLLCFLSFSVIMKVWSGTISD
jgi:hypothetical protein